MQADPLESRADTAFWPVLACFFLSGFAALLYEIVWLRQFSIVLGTSELAVATVLAAYMAGLAVGAAVAARFVGRMRRPILAYGLLEAGIALSALAVPLGLSLVRMLQVALLGGQPGPPDAGGVGTAIFYLAGAFAVVMVPTALMGATLPLLTRHAVRRGEQIGGRTGLLYAVNTGGAVLGTLTAAFVLLPRVGLAATVWVGVAINGLVFVIAALIARGKETEVEDKEPATGDSKREAERAASKRQRPRKKGRDRAAARTLGKATAAQESSVEARGGWVLPLMLLSGAVSFTYEVLWTRLLGHVLGGSLFAFATMLASFLTGITLGSAIASRLARSRQWAAAGLIASQLGIALLSILVYSLLDDLPGMARRLGAGEQAGLLANAAIASLVLLPATLCIGATFPFAVRLAARDPSDAGPAAARVYAFNTVGAIAGAILAGFIIIPDFGFAGTAIMAVAASALLAVLACLLWPSQSWRLLLPVGGSALLILTLFRPDPPDAILRASPFGGPAGTGRVVFSSVGRSATVLVLEQDGVFDLRTNGLPEARIAPHGKPPGYERNQRWLTALPVLARAGSPSPGSQTGRSA